MFDKAQRFLQCGGYRLSLDRPLVMAILNATPDSFSGDGLAGRRDTALRAAEAALAAGADILDVGGESSRPGAQAVTEQEELDRVVPLVEALRGCGVPLSVDTVKLGVMREALAAGASLINDINALQAPGAVELLASSDAAVCLMHMQGQPRSMQQAPHYVHVVAEVADFLRQRASVLAQAGVTPQRILIDPGFGFGKSLEHNCALFAQLAAFANTDYPLLVGVSRKSMLGAITGRPVEQRMAASVAAAVLAAQRGAAVLRVHDVAATCDALKVLRALDGLQP